MNHPYLSPAWNHRLAAAFDSPSFQHLTAFVEGERAIYQVFPPPDEVFTAFQLTPYEQANVVILGQDPYHDYGQAHGLCFSVKSGPTLPPSLVNMFKELQTDVGFQPRGHGYLVSWAEQGVLLLNGVLTVRAHAANSHRAKGWEPFTDAVLAALNEKTDRVVFVLWGAYAKKKAKLITSPHHVIIAGVHPSPLSAHRGFFGSRPFSQINTALTSAGKPPIDWQLPPLR